MFCVYVCMVLGLSHQPNLMSNLVFLAAMLRSSHKTKRKRRQYQCQCTVEGEMWWCHNSFIKELLPQFGEAWEPMCMFHGNTYLLLEHRTKLPLCLFDDKAVVANWNSNLPRIRFTGGVSGDLVCEPLEGHVIVFPVLFEFRTQHKHQVL